MGRELRRWRKKRDLSQLALAARAEVSTRHLSFVETGRSRPTAEMIVRLAEGLDVPMAEQNRLLLAGGYAPRYSQTPADDRTLAPVMAGLRHLLDAHAPYPALLLDDHWDVIDANQPVEALLADCDPQLLEPPINVIRLSLHPQGLSSRIRNLAEWRRHLLHQLDQRIANRGGDPVLVELRNEVAGYPSGGGPAPDHTLAPVLLLELASGDGELRLFSVASRITSPNDVTLDGLHLETFVPADDATRRALGQARS